MASLNSARANLVAHEHPNLHRLPLSSNAGQGRPDLPFSTAAFRIISIAELNPLVWLFLRPTAIAVSRPCAAEFFSELIFSNLYGYTTLQLPLMADRLIETV
jgi:hypothetical protein